MAISTNLLGKLSRQRKARNRVKGVVEDLREAQAYLFTVPGIAEQDPNSVGYPREPGVWIEFEVTDRKGNRHWEEMLFCRTKQEYHHAD